MRYRNKLPTLTTANGLYKSTDVNGNIVNNVTTNEILSKGSETMVDVVIPNFARRRDAGEVFNNPVYHTWYSEERTVGTEKKKFTAYPLNVEEHTGRNMSVYRRSGGAWNNGDSPLVFENWDDEYSSMIDTVRVKALAGIDRTPYRFLEDVAESRKTLQFLKAPLKQSQVLATLLDKTTRVTYSRMLPFLGRRGYPRTKAELWAVAFSRSWLELRYQFRPILVSILGVFEQANAAYATSKTNRARSSSSLDKVFSGSKSLTKTTSGYQYGFAQILKRHLVVSAGVLYEDLSPYSHDNFLWNNGLRVKDIPRTAWALMPYTFVLDRFIDIGTSISALVNLGDPTIRILAAWDRVLDTRSETWKHTSYTPASGWTVTSWTPSEDTVTQKYHNRTPWAPSLYDLSPIVAESVETETIADILTIVINKLSRARNL